MDRNLENIVNRVANRNSTNPSKAKLAAEIFFKNAKHLMQRDDMPTIMIHGFGKFGPDEGKIKSKLLSLKRSSLKNKITKEVFEEEKERLFKVLEVIKNNKQYRNINNSINN